MSSDEPVLPPRPEPPRPEDCCGSGCVRCIYAIYDDAMLEWEREVDRILAAAKGPPRSPASAATS